MISLLLESKQNQGQVLIIKISYKCTWDTTCLFPKELYLQDVKRILNLKGNWIAIKSKHKTTPIIL